MPMLEQDVSTTARLQLLLSTLQQQGRFHNSNLNDTVVVVVYSIEEWPCIQSEYAAADGVPRMMMPPTMRGGSSAWVAMLLPEGDGNSAAAAESRHRV
jgi:hypothetical protein